MRLMPFIADHHSDCQYLFWLNLASSHYAKTVIMYMREKKVNFVERSENPANMPENKAHRELLGNIEGISVRRQ